MIAKLRRIPEDELGAHFKRLVIDALERPQSAEGETFLATPTVVPVRPPAIRRVLPMGQPSWIVASSHRGNSTNAVPGGFGRPDERFHEEPRPALPPGAEPGLP